MDSFEKVKGKRTGMNMGTNTKGIGKDTKTFQWGRGYNSGKFGKSEFDFFAFTMFVTIFLEGEIE